ncbi:jg12754 [Pararge aegeria aegeria]|uniref:Jg12754 protein n=1 Tax=Pararge aegeria aegeria TaxID=348720 RepID=A0A8S4S8N9_9NEOP|nr:jg12754 [Pararge aegeria aegeria]
MALKHPRNNKAMKDDGVTADLLKAVGKSILKVVYVFTTVVQHIAKAWYRSKIILFYFSKKGDKTKLKELAAQPSLQI